MKYNYTRLTLMFDYCSSCLWVKRRAYTGTGGMIEPEYLRIPKNIQKRIVKWYMDYDNLVTLHFFNYGRFNKECNIMNIVHTHSLKYKILEKEQMKILKLLYKIYGRRFDLHYWDNKINKNLLYKRKR